MKELDEVVMYKGFKYTQVFKNEVGYIYSQEGYGKLLAYEVFLRKENSLYNCVSWPGDEAFGVWAWSVRDFERAKGYLDKTV